MNATITRVLAALALFGVLCGPAGAQPADAKKKNIGEAKRAFKAGQEFLQMDRYVDAIVEFRKAYTITQDKLVMGQIALAFEKAGDYVEALASIRVYREALPEGDRAAVDEMIKRFEKLIKEGRSKKLAFGAETVKEPDKKPEPERDKPTTPVDDKPKRKGRFWTWIVAGTTAAFALSALVVGLNAQSRFDELDSTCKPSCKQSDVDSVKTRAVAADVLWGITAASAVAATVLFFVEGRRAAKADAEDGEGKKEEKEDKEKEEEESSLRRPKERVARVRWLPLLGGGMTGLGAEIRY